jgi:hypothetical protein
MDTETKANFMKTSELYLKITESDHDASYIRDVASLLCFEHKQPNQSFQCAMSHLFDK